MKRTSFRGKSFEERAKAYSKLWFKTPSKFIGGTIVSKGTGPFKDMVIRIDPPSAGERRMVSATGEFNREFAEYLKTKNPQLFEHYAVKGARVGRMEVVELKGHLNEEHFNTLLWRHISMAEAHPKARPGMHATALIPELPLVYPLDGRSVAKAREFIQRVHEKEERRDPKLAPAMTLWRLDEAVREFHKMLSEFKWSTAGR
ncbi:hypothetical protein HY991_02490, partial [Candidatus Micrarchaeota archaeon]|nr:hypothetical protein [Candidatus Micrarchaeota archaeon]